MSRGRRPAAPRPAREAPDGPWLEPGEVRPSLLLLGPERLEAGFPDAVEAALSGGGVAALVLDPTAGPAAAWPGLAAACLARCRAASTALLLTGDPAAVIGCGADGVLLDSVPAIEPARRLLGLERPIGVACPAGRHALMEAGEAGADWLLLRSGGVATELAELVGWWSELFVLPCAAACAEPAAAGPLLAAGLDFLVPPPSIWQDAAGALAPWRAALAAAGGRSAA